MAFPVEVAPVAQRAVEYSVSAVGSVDAYERIQVTARVAGVVEEVRFREGTAVRSGQVLAAIEPARFRVAVAAARAALQKAEATRADAQAGLERREAAETRTPGLVAAEELETYRTRVRVAEAELAAARAGLSQAELNLRDAYVRAPASGVLETRTVQTGQYVQPGAVLATLVRRDPLLLRFQLPESDAARIAPGMIARFRTRAGSQHQATLRHVAGTADPATRMVEVIGDVAASDAAGLRPGTFAEITVPVGQNGAALVVPQTAIRPSEKGFLAYVVEGAVARERVLTLGMRTADGLVEVRSGLSAGERLVVRGGEALRDGATVRLPGAGPAAQNGPPAPPGRSTGKP